MLDLILTAIKAIAAFFGWAQQRELVEAGKQAETGEQARETLDLVKDVNRPIDDVERDSVWARLQAARKAK